jgi:hypothetical protein
MFAQEYNRHFKQIYEIDTRDDTEQAVSLLRQGVGRNKLFFLSKTTFVLQNHGVHASLTQIYTTITRRSNGKYWRCRRSDTARPTPVAVRAVRHLSISPYVLGRSPFTALFSLQYYLGLRRKPLFYTGESCVR